MDALTTEFNDEQLSALYPMGAERYYWNIARNKIIVDTLQKSGITNEKMLEIGCGGGVVLRELRSAGFDCYGVDLAKHVPPDDLVEYVHYGVDFKTLDPSFLSSVKVVLLFDVIEHIDNDLFFLESVKRTFPNLTRIVITVPAHMELWSNFDTFNGHIRRYTRHSLHKLLRTVGLEQRESSYFFHALYIPARAFAFFGLTRRTEVKPPSTGIMSRIHQIIARYFVLEHRFVPGFVRGTSIVSVANIIQK